MADDTERPELISRITSLVQQYAPSSLWQVDTLLAVLHVGADQHHQQRGGRVGELHGVCGWDV